MPDFLALHAAAAPDKPAVIDDRPDGTFLQWTFAELNDRVNRLAQVLLDSGAGPGVKVVWCGQNSPPVLTVAHACRKIGAIAVPLSYRLSPEEAAYVTDNSDAVVLFVDAEYAGLVEQIRPDVPKVKTVFVFDGDARDGMVAVDPVIAAASADEPQAPEDDIAGATMIYTSGTTGQPKGALRYGTDPEQTAALLALIGYRPDDIYVTTGPLYHSGPGGFAGVAHAVGNTIVIQRRFDPEDWLRLVDKHRVTSTFSAPTPIRMVCGLPAEVKARYDRSSMRVMVANAAPW